MGIDGTYGFVYCGNRGLGIGVFLVEGQRLEGARLRRRHLQEHCRSRWKGQHRD